MKIMHIIIHTFFSCNKYSLRTYYVPGIGSKNKERRCVLCFYGDCIVKYSKGEGTENIQINSINADQVVL